MAKNDNLILIYVDNWMVHTNLFALIASGWLTIRLRVFLRSGGICCAKILKKNVSSCGPRGIPTCVSVANSEHFESITKQEEILSRCRKKKWLNGSLENTLLIQTT